MTVATEVDLNALLYLKPSASGGRLCVTGTGVSMEAIAQHYKFEGLSAEDIHRDVYTHVPLEGIYAAIAYYLKHKAELDQKWEEDVHEYDRLKAYYEEHGDIPQDAAEKYRTESA